MLNLLYKDFKLMFGGSKNLSALIIKLIVGGLFVAIFIAIEIFLFTSILGKIQNFNNASNAFINLFLFIISLMLIVSGVVSANKLFFNDKDIEQLAVHPVSNSAVVTSKLFFLFLMHYATCFLFCYPLFIAYATMIGKGSWFYYLALFYPALTFFIEMGVSLLFVYPYYIIKKYLKKHVLLKFLTSLVLLFLLSFGYSRVLGLFINFIAGGNINQLVSASFINNIVEAQKYEVPLRFLIDFFLNRSMTNLFVYLFISLGVFLIGASITIFAFNYVRNISYSATREYKEKELTVKSINKALIEKEITLLTKNADYTSSFTSLLVVQPFLAYLVIHALNSIFTNGTFAYYMSVVPNFIKIVDIVIVMFFTIMIAQGASNYITMEKATIKVMKVMPISVRKQMFIKVSIPFVMSVSSLLITLVVLLLAGQMKLLTAGICLLLSVILLLVYTLVSLKEELSIKHKKPRNTLMSNVITYLMPVLFGALSIVFNFLGINVYLSLLICLAMYLLIILAFALYLKKKTTSLFLDLDMIN